MREASTDVAAMMQFLESWCPIYTPVWPSEIAHLVDLNLSKRARELGLQIDCECSDDPSVKRRRFNFWSVFNLCALAELGEETIIRMLDDDTLVFWLDLIESLIEEHGSGTLSIQVAMYVTDSRFFEAFRMEKSDWDLLAKVFVAASACMAACLHAHRIRTNSSFATGVTEHFRP